MLNIFKNFKVISFVLCTILYFMFTCVCEAYTTTNLGTEGTFWETTPRYSRLATDKNGNIWSAYLVVIPDGYGWYPWYLKIVSGKGNSVLSVVSSTNLGQSNRSSNGISCIAVDKNNHVWISVGFWYGSGTVNYENYIYQYDGSSFIQRTSSNTSISFTAIGVDPSDGLVWAAKSDGTLMKWNGGSFVSKPGTGWTVNGFIVDNSNNLWAYGSNGATAVWNGSLWVGKGTIPISFSKVMINPATGNLGAIGHNAVYEYDGSSWVYRTAINNGSYGGCYAIDGAIIDGYYYGTGGSEGWTEYIIDTILLNDGNIYTLRYHSDTFCTEGCSTTTTYPIIKYVFNTSSFALTPSPNGTTGQLRLIGQFDGRNVVNATIQYSTNGSGFSDLRIMQNGDGGVVTPTANTYWFRLKWFHRYHPVNPVNIFYTNSTSVPTITTTPSIGNTTGIAQWDAARGRSWVNLSWSPLTNASGYNLQIFDGNIYRVRNIDNVTSWNSRTAKVFPQSTNLPENNTVSTDPFRWDGSGVDFEDTAVRLYRSTVGTSYDSIKGYYFQLSAYNSWMESTPTLIYLELPNATDSAGPSGTISVTVSEGATAPATVTVNLSAVVDNSGGSGLGQMRFSNDNAAWSGWENFAVSKSWTTSSGEGQKTVYAQVKDNVGNTTTFSVSFWLGATLTQIYNEAQGSNQKAEAARQAAVDSKTSADAAKTAAQAASTNSSLAASNAQTAADRTYYAGKYGGNTENVADISGFIRYTQLPAIDSKADSIQSSVNNINNTVNSINTTVSGDDTAPTVYVKTLSGALATSGSSINMVVSASDNKSVTLTYSINGGPYQILPADGIISVPISNNGPNAITVRVKDEAGNIGLAALVIRKI